VTGALTFTAFWEDDPGPQWQSLFEHHWPHYRAWFLKEGERARASYAESRKMLSEHMPELVPVYERLCELAGGGDLEARLLSMWRPPPYLSGCSQAVWTRGEPMLVRNYDYAPDRIEGAILGTGWEGRRIIGVSDFLWGLLDGVNDAGLAVSLAFGGRRVVGRGFGVPLVLRYLLQTCETVAEARGVLERLPYHLAHTITLLDRTGAFVTAYVSPDRGVAFRDVAVATNHQEDVEWLEHAWATRSLEREHLIAVALDESPDPQGFAAAFLQPPVYSLDYAHAMGTLYTAVYKPRHGSVEYRWPELRWEHSFGHFREGTRNVSLLRTAHVA
jgi:predicted choloylglycine hydrolase